MNEDGASCNSLFFRRWNQPLNYDIASNGISEFFMRPVVKQLGVVGTNNGRLWMIIGIEEWHVPRVFYLPEADAGLIKLCMGPFSSMAD